MSKSDRIDVLRRLARSIEARKGADAKNSYTASLLAKAPAQPAKKLGEEAIEAAIAALAGDRDGLRMEAADVVYHLLVLLASQDVTLDDVLAELERREGVSGHDEKAARHWT